MITDNVKALIKEPLFWAGCILRAIFLFLFIPIISIEYYIPFLENTYQVFSLDPWSRWAEFGGESTAFPYGIMMWLSFLPGIIITNLFGQSYHIAYFTTIFAAEFVLLIILICTREQHTKEPLRYFWISPVTILLCYGYGFNDIIPVTYLILSLLYIKRAQLVYSGIFLAFAISAKLSMALALPLIIIYLHNNVGLRETKNRFLISFLSSASIVFAPFLYSSSIVLMIFQNPEVAKILSPRPFLEIKGLMLVPLTLTLASYWLWLGKRLDFNILFSIVGVVYIIVSLIFPETPGWLLWALPFVIHYQSSSRNFGPILVFIFSFVFVIHLLLLQPPKFSTILFQPNKELFILLGTVTPILTELMYTLLFCSGLIIALRMFSYSISNNIFSNWLHKPYIIGISGDSSTGKDTLASSLIQVLGKHSSLNISGDDYHKYDRENTAWRSKTHLNPSGNRLDLLFQQISKLKKNELIRKRFYNHQTGKLSELTTIKPKQYIVVSGLHVFFTEQLRKLFNLKIYLDMDEPLRKHFKIKRDTNERQKKLDAVLIDIERRRGDFKNFVRPQIENADITFKLMARSLNETSKNVNPKNLFLEVEFPIGTNEVLLRTALIGICKCKVLDIPSSKPTHQRLEIDGIVSTEQVELASKILFPELAEHITLSPKWERNMLGIMQLVTLAVMNAELSKI